MLPHPSVWAPHASLHGFPGTHAGGDVADFVQLPVPVSQVVSPGQDAQVSVPPQPSDPPHAPRGRALHVIGTQQAPWWHASPGRQSPQCFDDPSHEYASPQ